MRRTLVSLVVAFASLLPVNQAWATTPVKWRDPVRRPPLFKPGYPDGEFRSPPLTEVEKQFLKNPPMPIPFDTGGSDSPPDFRPKDRELPDGSQEVHIEEHWVTSDAVADAPRNPAVESARPRAFAEKVSWVDRFADWFIDTIPTFSVGLIVGAVLATLAIFFWYLPDRIREAEEEGRSRGYNKALSDAKKEARKAAPQVQTGAGYDAGYDRGHDDGQNGRPHRGQK